MNCDRLIFTGHAVQRMFERRIQKEQIRDLLQSGKVIAEYPNDVPFPSSLILGFLRDRPIHIVVAFDDLTKTCHIVTVYEPDPDQWSDDFRTRKP
jgi:hypothetical protein